MWLLRDGRTVLILSACQALFVSNMMTCVALTALVGHSLAHDKAFATVPVALLTIGAILTTGPASLLMQRLGRRAGFTLGAGAGMIAGLVCAYGVWRADFLIFCLGNLILGGYQGIAQFYRLAAADAVAPERRGQAVSLVLAGGIVAALVAPTLTLWSKDLFAPVLYAGSYLLVGAISLLSLLPVTLLTLRRLDHAASAGGRPLGAIIRQPVFITALVTAAVGQGIMVLVMNATPLAMVACSHTVADAAHVIQWHVLGMFVPSFFTGRLIDRFGAPATGAFGALVLAGSASVAAWDVDFLHFLASSTLLGIGWNFMYVAGSTLLTTSYTVEERGRVQGVAEMTVAATAALGSLAAGGLQATLGWSAVNVGMAPLLAVALAVNLWHGTRRTATATTA